jgi:hypothetical protein
MNIKDRKRIVRELTKNFKDRLEAIVSDEQFPKDWDGLHIRVIAQEHFKYDGPLINRAKRDIKKSMFKYRY